MPANLTPQYRKAEEAYRHAKTTEEKIAALEEMLTLIPKHKGTDHMQADLKKRLARLRAAPQQKGAAGKRPDPFHVDKGGAGRADGSRAQRLWARSCGDFGAGASTWRFS